ncbi:MAG: universal stress protein [Caulobacteraceae bacterium]
MGLAILWGEGGVLSLGQGVFFGLGGYAIAMHLKLVAETQAQATQDLQEVVARLSRHGIKAQVRVAALSGVSIAADLEDVAAKLDADLVVAGAYSHSRLNEWVLGGVTQDLLAGFKRYVLFSR